MTAPALTLGVIFPPDLPPERLLTVADAAEAAGVPQLWLWEDCFKESAIATAAAVLASTEHLAVGIGLIPVPLRNVALTAMELATIERMFPGRLVPGIGHGVLDWMRQVGSLAESPMTLLREYTIALRSLLHGERLTTAGRYVQLDDVALDWPPASSPPLLVGAVRERTLQLAGELGDGVILTGDSTPQAVRAAVAHVPADRAGRYDVVVFVPVDHTLTADAIEDRILQYTDAGATTVALLMVGDDTPELETWIATTGAQVAARVRER